MWQNFSSEQHCYRYTLDPKCELNEKKYHATTAFTNQLVWLQLSLIFLLSEIQWKMKKHSLSGFVQVSFITELTSHIFRGLGSPEALDLLHFWELFSEHIRNVLDMQGCCHPIKVVEIGNQIVRTSTILLYSYNNISCKSESNSPFLCFYFQRIRESFFWDTFFNPISFVGWDVSCLTIAIAAALSWVSQGYSIMQLNYQLQKNFKMR